MNELTIELLEALSDSLPFVLNPNLESWVVIQSNRKVDRDETIIKARAVIAKAKEVTR